jgi:uncharacterized protein YlxW (UPF0749 family)
MTENNDKTLPFSDRELIFIIAELRQDLRILNNSLDNLNSKVDKLEKDQSEIKAQINKWRGALPVVIAIGGIIGFVITIFDKLKNFFV